MVKHEPDCTRKLVSHQCVTETIMKEPSKINCKSGPVVWKHLRGPRDPPPDSGIPRVRDVPSLTPRAALQLD
jgi:hypothetical protein